MVPFAIDLREDQRWIAFATSSRIRPESFSSGFQATFNGAMERLRQLPSEWEVDLVTGAKLVEEWILEHPGVTKFTRIVRLHNPVDHIDDDRREMRQLAARIKTESFSAPRNKSLNVVDNPDFEQKLEGLDTGDVDVILVAREGGTIVKFRSRDHADETHVEEFGGDLELGMELVLRALQEYVSTRQDNTILE